MHVRSSNKPHAHTKTETDHHCGFYRNANNTNVKQLQIAQVNKNINLLSLSSSAFLWDNKPVCILSPHFHFYTYLKLFILSDLSSVTLMHCLAPGEAMHNDKRQECARENGLDCNIFKYLNRKTSSRTSSIWCHCFKMCQTANH